MKSNLIIPSALLRAICVLWCVLSVSIVSGQHKNRIFESFDVEQGLSSNWVRDIAQDKKGYIWLATSDGLNRFDGYNFKVYKRNEEDSKSLLVNYVRSIFVDNEDVLWVGYNGGISRYDAHLDAFSHFTNNPNNPSSISSDKISDITGDSKGNLWVATKDQGICQLDKITYNFRSYKHTNEQVNIQHVLHCDRKDRLWIGTMAAGIKVFDIPSKQYKMEIGSQPGMQNLFVTAVFEDAQGGIWVGTAKDGLYYFNEAQQLFERITTVPQDRMVAAIHQDVDGIIWVSSENAGLYLLDPKTQQSVNVRHNKYIPNTLGHNSINSILRDNANNMWLGTFASGVDLYKVPNNRFGHIVNDPSSTNSLSHNAVLCFAEASDKKLWIGTDDGGLNVYDPVTEKFRLYNKQNTAHSLTSDVILSVYEDKQKNIWVGTYLEGLLVMDSKTGKFKTKIPAHSFGSLLEDASSNFWLGSWRDGLFLYDRDRNTHKAFIHKDKDPSSLSDNFIYHVYEDKQKNIWVCTAMGLNLLEDKNTGKFRRFMNDPGNPNSLGDNTVYHCFEDSKGRFWVGTAGGLSVMNRDSIKFYTYKEKHGLANNSVLGIQEDESGKIWVSTNKGISCFDPQTRTFKNYDKSDGLQSNQFNIKALARLSSGELLFGGINGYNRFDPKDIRENEKLPAVTIKRLRAYNKNENNNHRKNQTIYNPEQKLVFDHTLSNLNIDFVAFNYANTKKVKYAYKLDGHDHDWHYTDLPTPVSYTNLLPGNYTFVAKAANEDGHWNEEGAKLTITIEPPFWSSWWVRVVGIAAAVALVYYLYKKKYVTIIRKQRILESRVQVKNKLIEEHQEQIDALKNELEGTQRN
jgi:ligand-binding sensor domain-containing protein